MQRRSRTGDLLLAGGVLISVAIAVVSTILSDISAAIFLAGLLIGVVVALQVDLVSRMTRRASSDAAHLRLMGQILGSGAMAPHLASIARVIASSPAVTSAPLGTLAEGRLEGSRTHLQRLSDGQIVLPDGDLSLMLNQIREVTKTIHATTFTDVDYDWWTCPTGQTYLQVNAEAIARGAQIERVFVYETWDEKAAELANAQLQIGIRLYRVARAQLSAELLRNMVIYDRTFLVEDEVDLNGSVTGCLHAVNETTVRGAMSAFERIKLEAEMMRV
jgi:hypothetical protein